MNTATAARLASLTACYEGTPNQRLQQVVANHPGSDAAALAQRQLDQWSAGRNASKQRKQAQKERVMQMRRQRLEGLL